jgi:hypothetical protein
VAARALNRDSVCRQISSKDICGKIAFYLIGIGSRIKPSGGMLISLI